RFGGDAARAADREPRPRKRMPVDKTSGQAQFAAKRPDLVLEQLAQGFDETHVHALGKTADIMMRFYRDRRPAAKRDAFDHIWIERALRQKFRHSAAIRGDSFGLAFERRDEQAPYDLAFFFRVHD